MAAEYDDLPEAVKKEVQTFADVNVAWLSKVLSAANVVSSEESESRARAIFSAVAGAQLMARSRSDISLYDSLLIPTGWSVFYRPKRYSVPQPLGAALSGSPSKRSPDYNIYCIYNN